MSVEEIFSKIANHLAIGLLFHNQLISVYGFLNLKGYQQQQQRQYFEECHNYLDLKQFYFNQYGKMIQEDEEIKRPKLIPGNWYKYTKSEVDTSTKRTTIRDMFKQWIKWEEDTKLLLSNCYFQLMELKQICGANKILNMLSQVNQELSRARKQQIDLQTIGYDIVYIVDNQNKIKLEDDDK